MLNNAHAPDYTDVFEVTLAGVDALSAEQWSRAVLEGAPRPVRWFLLTGWRAVLGLRLGPPSSPDHVLGWRIASNDAEMIRLESHSSLMTAWLILRVTGSTVVLSTNVDYARRMSRPLWAAVGPIHRRTIPYLLGRGLSSLPTTFGDSTSR